MTSLKNLKAKVDGDCIDLSVMRLTDVPVDDIAAISKVKEVDLSCNEIYSLPLSFAESLGHIVKLDIRSNKLSSLPSNFGKLHSLKHLDLYNNQLTELPYSFGELQELRWVDVKGNPLRKDFATAAGQCGDYKECSLAAKRLLLLCSKQKETYEKDLQMKQNKQKEQDDLQRKQEIEEKTRKNAAKKQAKEQQKKVEKAAQLKQKSGITPEGASTISNGQTKAHAKEMPTKKQGANTNNERKQTKRGGFSWIARLNLLLAILLLSAGVFSFYIYSDGDFSRAGAQKAFKKYEENGKFLVEHSRPYANWTLDKIHKGFNATVIVTKSVYQSVKSNVVDTYNSFGSDSRPVMRKAYDDLSERMMQLSEVVKTWYGRLSEFHWCDTLTSWTGICLHSIGSVLSFFWAQLMVVYEEIMRNEAVQSMIKTYGPGVRELGYSAYGYTIQAFEFASQLMREILNNFVDVWLPQMQKKYCYWV